MQSIRVDLNNIYCVIKCDVRQDSYWSIHVLHLVCKPFLFSFFKFLLFFFLLGQSFVSCELCHAACLTIISVWSYGPY